MASDHFSEVISVGSTTIAIREERLEGNERILLVDAPGLTCRVSLLSYYTPSTTVVRQTLVLWGGRRLFAMNVSNHATCNNQFEVDIVAVLPSREHILVVTELAAILIDDKCEVVSTLLTHDEIIVEAQCSGGRLNVRDLQGRIVSVDIPEA